MAQTPDPNPLIDASTIVEVLRWRAAHQPDNRAYTFLADGEAEENHFTYETLDQRARAIAARLQALNQSSERVLLLYPPGLDYLAAFFGCLYAGAIAVPAYPPRLNRPMDRLQAILADAQVRIALTTTSIQASLERRSALLPELSRVQWMTTDDPAEGAEADWRQPAITPDTVAFLQYTSGSTSTPKGVILTHGNLMHNLGLICHGFQLRAGDSAVLWLPVYHDMGLVGGILEPLYLGSHSVLMSPVAFLQRPARWLEAMTRYRATNSGAPNFAYQLCVDKITPEQRAGLDLSHWRVAFCGAEPIHRDTLDRFAEAFGPCGFRPEAFYPCYGLAETTLFGTGGRGPARLIVLTVQRSALEQNRVVEAPAMEKGTHTLVGSGQALLDQKVIIVNPETLTRCAPDEVGEIWIASASVAQGYWNRLEETERTFRAYRADTGEGPFLRTGDLGFIRSGELFVTGRLKDLIIIRGRNVHPQDIELAVAQSHPALRADSGAAFSVEAGGEERLVVVQEVERQFLRNLNVAEVVGVIRQTIAEDFELQVYAVVLVETLSVPKTSSGKTQRHACRSKFLEGSLKVVGEWRANVAELTIEASTISQAEAASPVAESRQSTAEIEAWLIAHLARELGITAEEIDVRRPFAYYGLSSVQGVNLAAELETWLGLRLSPTLAYDYPSIVSLARYLASDSAAPEPSAATPTGTGRATEPIAIIGIGCRFPGARGPAAFWQLLRNGVDAITDIPIERGALRTFFDQNPTLPDELGTALPHWGGFLNQIDRFDPHFFGITPREAARIDPQQRLLLEVAWDALEDAGQAIERLAGTRTGVFIGISSNDYGQWQLGDPGLSDPYAGTGSALSIAANRLSYVFDFRGPSMAVDTACSSSLVAVHLACQSLRRGECHLALAGGVNVILSPAITVNFTQAGFMAPDGRCKAFDARADGYVRGEGVGVVVLKPLSRALADGDPIYAVIRGSAVNNDGRTNGLTAPSRHAQEAVLREAYQQAGVSPGDVQYVEAHGTGTALGDPIEAEALGAVLAAGRDPDRHCSLGSVKTNIGHLEAAAGIAGLIKTALALKHREIPPSLHFQEPNPRIPFDRLPLRVQPTLIPWPDGFGPALAGASSFGFGGANAHVVLEEAPRPAAPIPADQCAPDRVYLVPLSAHSPEALRSLARAYLDFLSAEENAAWPDIGYSASVRRSHHDHRLTLVAHTRDKAAQSLQAFLQGESRPELAVGRHIPSQRPRVLFVFGGQGPQWWAMGRELLEHEPVFRATVEACDRLLAQSADWSLLAELRADESHSRLNDTEIAQPALFALQVALAALWAQWGVRPDGVVGHSLGEVAAAHVAGALSLEDAVRVVFHRGRLMQRVAGQGKMAMVELSPEAAKRAMMGYEDRLSLAAINSPTSTVLSGEPNALAAVLDSLRQQGIFYRELRGDYAFHSAQMEPLQSELGQALQGLSVRPATLPIFSTVTGEAADGRDFDARYWQRQIREPVRFAEVVDRLAQAGHRHFVEIGPHPVLSAVIQQCFRERGQEGVVLPSLRRGEEERVTLLASLGALYAQGYPLDWRRLYPAGGRCVPLPAYPWQHERYWLETEGARFPFNWHTPRDGQTHPLLGRPLPLAHRAEEHVWENTFDRRRLPYMEDHQFQSAVVLPGAAYVEMALAAAAKVFGDGPHTLTEIEFRRPLFLPENGTRTVQLVLSLDANGTASFRIFSRPDGEAQQDEAWILHASGQIRPGADDNALGQSEQDGVETIRARCREEISKENYYRSLRERGLRYGPRFQGITQIWRRDGEALGEVQAPQAVQSELGNYHLHPTLLDACAQVLVAVEAGDGSRPFLPVRVDEVRFFARPGARIWSHARLQPQADQHGNGLVGNVRLLDDVGGVIAEAIGLRVQYLDSTAPRTVQPNPDEWLYEIQWQPKAHAETQPPAQATAPGTWFIFADAQGAGEAIVARVAEAGERCVVVSPGIAYERCEHDRVSIRPAHPEDIRQLFEDALKDQPPCRGVIYLWSLDMLSPEATNAAALEADQLRGVGTVVSLVQVLAQVEWKHAARLWLVTRGTQSMNGEAVPVAVSQATLWGLGRTIAQEHPALWGGLIDLNHASPDEASALLWRELASPDGENQIAIRNGERYVARLIRTRARPDRAAPLRWRPDASYLITGGLGGLGLLAAKWMVEQGARRVILLGRTALPPRAEWDRIEKGSRLAEQVAAIRDLESLGASVHLAAVNVSDEAQLAAYLDTFRREGWPPIRGVVHAAGMLQDQILLRLDTTTLAMVFSAKVTGGWLLHRLLEDAPLDFFVMFSSAASLLGSAGQGNYAAANAFLDALAHHRRAQGLPGLSINWGPWAEAGMAARPDRRDRLARQGIGSILPEQGLEVFGRLLRQDSTHVGVMPIHWAQLFEAYPEFRGSPFLTYLTPEAAPAKAERTNGEIRSARDAILSAAPGERRQLLETIIREQVASVSGIPAARLDVHQPLTTMGIDSLMGIELRTRVQVESGVVIPLAKLLEGPTLAELTTLLLDQITATPAALSPTQSPAKPVAAERAMGEAMAPVVIIQPAGSRPPFFCVHPGALDVQCYAGLAYYLSDDQPFYALQPAELDTHRSFDDEPAVDVSIPEMVARCIAALQSVQPRGPYHLGGWSLGGVLAFEIACELDKQGEGVSLLALFDSPAPPSGTGKQRPDDYDDAALLPVFMAYLGARRGKQLAIEYDDVRNLDVEKRFKQMLEKAKAAEVLPSEAEPSQFRFLFQTYKSGLRRAIRKLWEFEPQVYPRRIVYFRASEVHDTFDDVFPHATTTWSQLTADRLEVYDVPADHYTMFLEPHVQALAERLSQFLDAPRTGR